MSMGLVRSGPWISIEPLKSVNSVFGRPGGGITCFPESLATPWRAIALKFTFQCALIDLETGDAFRLLPGLESVLPVL